MCHLLKHINCFYNSKRDRKIKVSELIMLNSSELIKIIFFRKNEPQSIPLRVTTTI